MKEQPSYGICHIWSERKGTVLQGRHCVSDVETSGLCDPLKSWRKCVLLAHTRWWNSVLHRWLMYKAEKAQGGRFVGEVWEQRGRRPGKSCFEQLRTPLIFSDLLKVHNVETAFFFLWFTWKKVSVAKVQLIFFCTCLKNLIHNFNTGLVRREKHVLSRRVHKNPLLPLLCPEERLKEGYAWLQSCISIIAL